MSDRNPDNPPTRRVTSLWRAPAVWLGAAAFVIALVLYAPDADGAFAIYDGAWYGHFAQYIPAHSILPHHPLFHAVVALVAEILALAGLANPGHMAVRVVGGLGGALVLVLIARLAGPERRWVGAAFAFMLFATRGFIAEIATGENLFPAYAATLVLFEMATRKTPNLKAISAMLAVGLCLRQDTLLILPGILIVVAPTLPAGRRLRPLAAMILVAGAIAACFYVAAWAWAQTSTHEDLLSYLTRFGRLARWEGPASVGTNLALHFGSGGAMILGRHWFSPIPHVLIFGTWVAVVAIATRLLRGDDPFRRYAVLVFTTIALRLPFYAWFEPHNFEWQILPMVLLLALGSRAARGIPATSLAARRAGMLLLFLTGAAVLAAHAPNTWTLRQRRLADAVGAAIDAGGKRAWFLPMDKNAMLALELRGRQYDQLDIPYGAKLEMLADLAMKKRELLGRPIVMVGDRFVETGMPWDLAHAGDGFRALEAIPAGAPGVRVLRYEGKAFAAVLADR